MSNKNKKFQIDCKSASELYMQLYHPGLSVVELYSSWCGPSKPVESIFGSIALQNLDNSVKFIRIESKKLPEFRKYHCRCRPVFLIIFAGILERIIVGLNTPVFNDVVAGFASRSPLKNTINNENYEMPDPLKVPFYKLIPHICKESDLSVTAKANIQEYLTQLEEREKEIASYSRPATGTAAARSGTPNTNEAVPTVTNGPKKTIHIFNPELYIEPEYLQNDKFFSEFRRHVSTAIEQSIEQYGIRTNDTQTGEDNESCPTLQALYDSEIESRFTEPYTNEWSNIQEIETEPHISELSTERIEHSYKIPCPNDVLESEFLGKIVNIIQEDIQPKDEEAIPEGEVMTTSEMELFIAKEKQKNQEGISEEVEEKTKEGNNKIGQESKGDEKKTTDEPVNKTEDEEANYSNEIYEIATDINKSPEESKEIIINGPARPETVDLEESEEIAKEEQNEINNSNSNNNNKPENRKEEEKEKQSEESTSENPNMKEEEKSPIKNVDGNQEEIKFDEMSNEELLTDNIIENEENKIEYDMLDNTQED